MVEEPKRRYYQQVTNVEAKDTTNVYEKAAGTLMKTGEKIAYQSANAQMTDTLAQTQLKLSELTNQFRIDSSGNPDWKNPDYVSKRNDLFNQMQEQVNPLVKNDFNLKLKELEANNDMSNQAWSVKQNQENTIYSLQNTMKTMNQSAYLAGATAGETGNDNYLDLKKNWDFSINNLAASASSVLGKNDTLKSLDNAKSDAIREYASGLMYNNPAKAIEFLNREDVANDINNPEVHLKLKEAAFNRLGRIDEVKVQKEALVDINGENSLILRSQTENIPFDELQQSLETGNHSQDFKSLVMKMNGWSAEKKPELTPEAKNEFKANIYDMLSNEDIKKNPKGLKQLQSVIVKGLNNKSLGQDEANSLINQVVTPMAEIYKDKVDRFDQTSLFSDDFGFSQLNEFIGSKPSLPSGLEKKQKEEAKDIRDINYNKKKVQLYDYYFNALNDEAAKRNISLMDLANRGTPIEKLEVYNAAATKAIEMSKKAQYPVFNRLEGMPSKILSRNGLEPVKPVGDLKMPSINLTNDILLKAGSYTDGQGNLKYYTKASDGSYHNITEEEYRSFNAGY
jgi:hypothetical protein